MKNIDEFKVCYGFVIGNAGENADECDYEDHPLFDEEYNYIEFEDLVRQKCNCSVEELGIHLESSGSYYNYDDIIVISESCIELGKCKKNYDTYYTLIKSEEKWDSMFEEFCEKTGIPFKEPQIMLVNYNHNPDERLEE